MRPLPAVLLDLHEQLATGKLTLMRGRLSKTVDLVNGNPVSSTSTPRDETLGHFLVNSGVITEEEHKRAVARAAEVGGKLGEALVALRTLTVEQLIDQLGRQARHKIVQALRWPQGAWRFDDGDAIEGMQLRMVEVVLVGLRETAVDDLDRLARFDGMSFELTRRGVRLRHELKRVFGEKLVALLGDGAPIEALERAMLDRVPARIALDAMILCDAVEANVGDMGLAGATLRDLKLPAAEPVVMTKPRTISTIKLSSGPALFDMLFDDIGLELDGAAPIEMPEEEDSGVVHLAEVNAERDALTNTRKQMIVEHQRAKGADHYAVLMVNRRATAQEIDTASGIRANMLEHQEGILTDPRDRAKIGELRELYAVARSVLLDDRRRAAYDRELAGGELVQVPPAIDTELNFRVAEELIGKRQWSQAINMIRTVISRSPGEADYHAALGWAEWNAGERAPEAADRARPHLNAALEINPDHAAAHDYKGQIDAALRSDDAEALFHLERALDLDPARIDAVQAVETLLFARGELRRYERILKRLLFRLRGRGTTAEAKAWARLARLYHDHLDDPQASAAAAANAKRISPKDLRRHRPDPACQPQRTVARGLARGAARSAIGRRAGQDHRGERACRRRVPRRGDDGRAAHRRRPDGERLRDASRAHDLDPRAAARSRSMGTAPPQGRQPRARWPDRAGRAGGSRDRADDARRQRSRLEPADRRHGSAGVVPPAARQVRRAARGRARAGVSACRARLADPRGREQPAGAGRRRRRAAIPRATGAGVPPGPRDDLLVAGPRRRGLSPGARAASDRDGGVPRGVGLGGRR